MGKTKHKPADYFVDETCGKVGTPARDAMEDEITEELHAYQIGEIIKGLRKGQGLTQEALGEKIGVKKAQISKIENGQTMTLRTMSRVFCALGITSGELLLSNGQKLSLW